MSKNEVTIHLLEDSAFTKVAEIMENAVERIKKSERKMKRTECKWERQEKGYPYKTGCGKFSDVLIQNDWIYCPICGGKLV